MTVTSRTQVGIVGAGPAGLLLSHLLALRGIDSIVVENRSRAYCEARQRAGLLEAGTVELLRTVGLGDRMDAEGLEHGGIYLQFEGERHHLDFRDLTGGRWVTIYAQTEIVKDLIRTRLAAGAMIEFEVSDTEVGELDTERPVLRFTDAGGTRHEVACDAIAGCDGFHGICRDSMPPGLHPGGRARVPVLLARHPGRTCRRPPTSSSTAGTRTASPCTPCAPRRSAGSTCRSPPTRTSRRGPTTGSGPSSGTGWRCRGWELKDGPHQREGHLADAQLRGLADALRAAVPGRRRGAHRAADRGQGPEPGPRRRDRPGQGADQPAAGRRSGSGRRLLGHEPDAGSGGPPTSPGG